MVTVQEILITVASHVVLKISSTRQMSKIVTPLVTRGNATAAVFCQMLLTCLARPTKQPDADGWAWQTVISQVATFHQAAARTQFMTVWRSSRSYEFIKVI